MKLLFIRHAETALNKQFLTHKPGTKIGLTEKGKEQARKVAEVCKQYGVEMLYTSPETRAQETAKIMSGHLHLEPKPSPLLVERKWGDWAGKPWEQIETELNHLPLEERYTFVPPNGESWYDMEQRLSRALYEIVLNKKNVAVVMHDGALRALLPVLKKMPKSQSLHYDFANASVTVFNYDNNEYTEEIVNDTRHLQ